MKYTFISSLIIMLTILASSCEESKSTKSTLFNRRRNQPLLQCPENFIYVSGNNTLQTNEFCVMQYEARVDGANNLVLDPNQYPKTLVSYTEAFNICKNHSDESFTGTFALISNAEWMTLAREIESNPKNWSSGNVGSGMLAKGHSDGIAFDYLQTNTIAAVTNITDLADYYNQTGNLATQPYRPDAGFDMEVYNGGSSIYGWEQRRIHYLNTGEIIWDLSGNAAEYVDWSSSDEHYTFGPTDAYVDKEEVTNLFGSIIAEDLSPVGNYDSSYGMGKWVMRDDDSRGVVLRGGHAVEGSIAGIYSLATTMDQTNKGVKTVSFRCVYRP
jgi:hypothetical protein